MEKIGFIKNWEMLQENYRDNSSGFENEIKKFSAYLTKLPDTNAVLGFIGKFGTGKSNMLEGVKKKNNESEIWIQFDAWKYPERNHLWENFTLEISNKLFPEQYMRFCNKVNGKIPWKEKVGWFIDSLSALGNILSPGSGIVPTMAWRLFGGYKKKDKLERLHEFQTIVIEILKKHTKDNNKNIYIVIEDIDRSSDAGIFFIETLNYLLRNNIFSKRIIVIIPIGSPEYSSHIDSYTKCLDFVNFSQLPSPDMRKFVEDVFNADIFTIDKNSREQIIRFFDELINLPDGNIRKIKLLLRDAAIIYAKIPEEEKERYDWRVVIAFVAMKYFKINREGFEGSYAQYFQNKHMELIAPFQRLFLAIVREKTDLNPKLDEPLYRFKFDEINSSLPLVPAPEHLGQKIEGKIGLHYKEIMLVR